MTHRSRLAVAGRRKIAGLLHRWHRRIGAAASLFIVWLVISGWMLNHSDSLRLAQHEIHAGAVLDWYGIKGTKPSRVMRTANHWLVADGSAVTLDGKLLPVASVDAIGMTEVNGMLFVAGSSNLMLLSSAGELLDREEGSTLPVRKITRIGSGCNGVVIDDDRQRFASDDGITWNVCTANVAWAQDAPITPAQLAAVEPLFRPGISYERLLLDMHSGRILGAWGVYLIDAIGGGLMVLAMSGLWMFSRQRTHRRQLHRHEQNRSART